jgi:hypothetical protein
MNTNILLQTRKLILTIGIVLSSVLGFAIIPAGHFVPAFQGNGQNHMNLYVVKAEVNGVALQPGDEIAAFDGSICCGIWKLEVAISFSDYNSFAKIAASAKDAGLLNGYTPGNPITYKFWDASQSEEFSGISAEYINIDNETITAPTYTVDASALVKLSFTTQNNPLPDPAGTITGSATVCQGQNSVVYTVPTIANATSYVWTLPTGATGTSETNSITVS